MTVFRHVGSADTQRKPVGAAGIEKIYELKLTSDETAALHKSANAVKELVDVTKSKM